MPAPVVVTFAVGGLSDVKRAFSTVQDGLLKLEKSRASTEKRASGERTRIADTEAKAKLRLFERAEKDAERMRQNAVKAADKSAREQTRIAQKLADEEERARERSAAATARLAEKEAAAKAKWHQKAHRDLLKLLQEETDAQDRSRKRFAGGVASGVMRGAGRGASAIASGAFALAGGVAQLGGGFSIADSVAQRLALEKSASLFSNAGYIKGKAGNERVSNKDIVNRARAASIETGVDANELVMASKSYVDKTADMGSAMSNMSFFGKIAKATGADVTEVAGAAGLLRSQNKELSADAVKDLLLTVVSQGKGGNISLADLAGNAGKITRSASAYEGSQTANQAKMLGLAQIAYTTAGSSAAAGTAVSAISGDIIKQEAMAEKSGGPSPVNFAFGKNGKLRSIDDVISDTFSKSNGNSVEIAKMGFGKQSIKVFQALQADFDRGAAEAEEKAAAGGKKLSGKDRTAAGVDAVRARMHEVDGGGYDKDTLEEDHKNVMEGTGEQLEAAFRKLRDSVGEELVPELLKLIPVLKSGIPVFEDLLSKVIRLANWASENPYKGLGLAFTGFIGKELAAAAVGEGVKSVLMRMLAGGGGGGVPGIAAPIAGGGALAGAAVLGLTTVIGTEIASGVKNDKIVKDKSQEGFGSALDLNNSIYATKNKLARGEMTPEEAKARRAKAVELVEEAKKRNTVGTQAMGFVSAPFSSVSDGAARNVGAAAYQGAFDKMLPDLIKALGELDKTIADNSKKTQANTLATGDGAAPPIASPAAPNRNAPNVSQDTSHK